MDSSTDIKPEADNNPLSFNPLLLLKNQDSFVQKIVWLNDEAATKIGNKQYSSAIQYLSKALDMISLSRSANRQITPLLLICLNYNIAAAYEGAWVLENCFTYSQMTIEQLKKYTQSINDPLQKIHYNLFLFKLKLQFCAILSQLGKHELALQLSYENRKQYLKTLKEIQGRIGTTLTKQQSPTMSIMPFNKRIQRSLESLNKLIEQIQDQNFERLKHISLYNWKNNPQMNEKQIKQYFSHNNKQQKNAASRSLLGVTQDDWLSSFNIGSVMHIPSITYNSFTKIKFIGQQIFMRNFQQKVLLASILYFTISTEMRLIQNDSANTNVSKGKRHSKPNKLIYSEQAQLYHFKSISLVCQHFSHSFPYMNHINNTFYKHYLQQLKEIQQKQQSYINDISMLSSPQSKEQLQDSQINNNFQAEYIESMKPTLCLKLSGCETQPVAEGQKSTKPHSKPKLKKESKLARVKSEEEFKKINNKSKNKSKIKQNTKRQLGHNKSKTKLSEPQKLIGSPSKLKTRSNILKHSKSVRSVRSPGAHSTIVNS